MEWTLNRHQTPISFPRNKQRYQRNLLHLIRYSFFLHPGSSDGGEINYQLPADQSSSVQWLDSSPVKQASQHQHYFIQSVLPGAMH